MKRASSSSASVRTSFAIAILFSACSAAPRTSSTSTSTKPTAPGTSAPGGPSAARVDAKAAATKLAAILNDGARAADFVTATAPSLEVTFVVECSEESRREDKSTVVTDEARRTWHAANAATWAADCAVEERPKRCKWSNPLEFPAEVATCAGRCCALDGAGLHNTPFLTRVCLDEAGRVSAITIEDGC